MATIARVEVQPNSPRGQEVTSVAPAVTTPSLEPLLTSQKDAQTTESCWKEVGRMARWVGPIAAAASTSILFLIR